MEYILFALSFFIKYYLNILIIYVFMLNKMDVLNLSKIWFPRNHKKYIIYGQLVRVDLKTQDKEFI